MYVQVYIKVLLYGVGLIITMSPIHPATSLVEDANYWKSLGQAEIEASLRIKYNEGISKNVILFVGDGMGLASITTGRIFKGQLEGKTGEEGFLSFEKFPHVGLLKTYNMDRQVPDSAGTATALFSGVKTNFYTIGLDGTSTFNVCRSDEANTKVTNMIDWAIEAGKSTGVVTTTRVTHATPAAAYAHSANRDWECDSEIPESQRGLGCKDIARQLVEDEPGKSINVIFAGGEQVLRASINSTSACTRNDTKDLVWEWMQMQKMKGKKYRFVNNKEQMMNTKNSTEHILGLFAHSHIPYDKERDQSLTGQPSLEEMMVKAIQILSLNPKGYVLIVEGGRIDHAHHDNLAKIALEEVVAFDLAIGKAIKLTQKEETLIVVTADHSHSFEMTGYPKRGNPIGGIGDVTSEGFAYETLSYINGPGYTYHRLNDAQHHDEHLSNSTGNNTFSTINTWRNLNLTKENSLNRSELHFAGFWTDSETHSGTDVPVYASGPMSHLFSGVHEQTHVSYSIAYSSCIGPYLKKCRTGPPTVGASAGENPKSRSNSAPHPTRLQFRFKTFLLFFTIFFTPRLLL